MFKRFLAVVLVLMLLVPVAALADLMVGDKSDAVLDAQRRLAYYGYYTKGLDGSFGNGTFQAVKEFQSANAIPATGIVDSATMTLLSGSTAVHKAGSTPATNRTLKYNSEGADVIAAQQRLAHYGYYSGAFDGIFGAGTENAVRRFQRNNGLSVDGKIGPATRKALFSATAKPFTDPVYSETLKRGSHGAEVVELQRQLAFTYYYVGAYDGIFGSNVEAAVKAFQSSTGLNADGKVGPTTYHALLDRSASIFNGGIPRRSLSAGSRGWDVYVLQQKLNDMNYLSSIVTPGYYDSTTVSAIVSFQKDNGLEADGKAGATVRRYIWPSVVDKEDIGNKKAQDGNPMLPVSQPTLRKGSSGAEVSNLQMRLKAAGLLLGNADGVYGDSTVKAVKQLQKYFGIKQDGVVGPTTWAYVNTLDVVNAEPIIIVSGQKASTTPVEPLRQGMRNSNVAKLQVGLAAVGLLNNSDVDGIFGPKTKAAVTQYQKASLLAMDGVAGAQTLVTLNDHLNLLMR